MKYELFVVPDLSVRVVTGDTCYPNENGFSSISAEVAPADSNLAEQLSRVQKSRQVVTLRCAMLDVTGKITNSLSKDGKKVFVLIVDDMTYRRPGDKTK